jgi:hypothetical protein
MATPTAGTNPAPTMIRWGAVVAGAIIGLAVVVLIVSLFAAIGGEAQGIADNLHWFGFAAALIGLFVAGLLAGWISGVRGATSGMFHGITAWGLLLVVALAFPQAFGAFEAFATPLEEIGTGPLWAAFLSVVGGLILAAVGGLIGGAISRPAEVTPRRGYERGAYGEGPAQPYRSEELRRAQEARGLQEGRTTQAPRAGEPTRMGQPTRTGQEARGGRRR